MHWLDIQNLKVAATSHAEDSSVEELERKIAEKNAVAKASRSTIVNLEHEMKAKAEILKYAKQYMANRKYQRKYEKAKDQDAYFRSHETDPEPEEELGKFELMRKSYLINHRRGIYSGLLLSGELKKHLLTIQEQAGAEIICPICKFYAILRSI